MTSSSRCPKLAGQELLGQKAYGSLAEIPHPVDMVDVFRNADAAHGDKNRHRCGSVDGTDGLAVLDANSCRSRAIYLEIPARPAARNAHDRQVRTIVMRGTRRACMAQAISGARSFGAKSR